MMQIYNKKQLTTIKIGMFQNKKIAVNKLFTAIL